MKKVNFSEVNQAALVSLPAILSRWLPNGRCEGQEWVSLNPLRSDKKRGSFKVNLRTGKWSDFATGDRGGDPISLGAYLHGLGQLEAAKRLAKMLGVPHE